MTRRTFTARLDFTFDVRKKANLNFIVLEKEKILLDESLVTKGYEVDHSLLLLLSKCLHKVGQECRYGDLKLETSSKRLYDKLKGSESYTNPKLHSFARVVQNNLDCYGSVSLNLVSN